jgi:hypothetical protein
MDTDALAGKWLCGSFGFRLGGMCHPVRPVPRVRRVRPASAPDKIPAVIPAHAFHKVPPPSHPDGGKRRRKPGVRGRFRYRGKKPSYSPLKFLDNPEGDRLTAAPRLFRDSEAVPAPPSALRKAAPGPSSHRGTSKTPNAAPSPRKKPFSAEVWG